MSETATSNQEPSNAMGKCFVIMPYGGWFDEYYEDIYKPAILAAGLRPERADDLYRPGTIIDDIWAMAQAAEIVLADLTGRNPNVFYELGLAHAIAKPVVMVVDSVEEIPFDLRGLRIIVYDKNRAKWGEVLKRDVQQALQELAEAPGAGVPATFIRVKSRNSQSTEVSQEAKDILQLQQDLNNLRKELRGEAPAVAALSDLQAREHVELYVRRGMQTAEIMRRLVPKGVSERLIREEIMRLASS